MNIDEIISILNENFSERKWAKQERSYLYFIHDNIKFILFFTNGFFRGKKCVGVVEEDESSNMVWEIGIYELEEYGFSLYEPKLERQSEFWFEMNNGLEKFREEKLIEDITSKKNKSIIVKKTIEKIEIGVCDLDLPR